MSIHISDFVKEDVSDFSNKISNNLANIKENIKSNFKVNKMPNLKTNTNILKRKKDTEFFNISWKTYRTISIIILFLSIFLCHYIRITLFPAHQPPYQYLEIILRLVLVFFIINLGIFLFYITYFRYISTLKGKKGLKGNRGKRGLQGNNSVCDISKQKIGNFYRDKTLIKKEKIDMTKDDNTFIDYKELTKSQTGWIPVSNKISNKIIGINCSNNKCKKKNNIKEQYKKNNIKYNKPIIGAVINYNNNTNKIIALEYLFDKNKTHNKNNYLVGRFGIKKNKKNDGTIGNPSNRSRGMQKHNFICPANSAIYKVEGMYDSSGVKGVKFYCQDIFTGKNVKSFNNNNKKVYGVSFGIEPKIDSEDYQYSKSECISKDNKPSFISNIGGDYNKKTNNLMNLKFNRCSIYNK